MNTKTNTEVQIETHRELVELTKAAFRLAQEARHQASDRADGSWSHASKVYLASQEAHTKARRMLRYWQEQLLEDKRKEEWDSRSHLRN